MKFRIAVVICCLCFSSHSFAQKIKYKDLIVLLSSKQYDKAEPFLKKYLKDLKDKTDNPNALLYMGIIYQDKLSKNDPLLQTELLCSNIDSALLFYDQAYKTIDDRELRKNDEYYEAYTRRDLRTGKFVIKLSDVQLDIENRSNNLKDRKNKIKLLKENLVASSNAYNHSNKIFLSIQEKYTTENEFLLRSDEETIKLLKGLTVVFDSCIEVFNEYSKISKELGKTGHNQVISLQEIKDMKRDGSSVADFMVDDLKLWDYKRWANHSIEKIEKEINPMREHLVTYDIEIGKLRSRLLKDSVSVKNDVVKLYNKVMGDQLKKYDPNPMPLEIFAMKTAELEYRSDLILNKKFRDSADVRLKLASVKIELSDIRNLDSIATDLLKKNFEEENKNYNHFITKTFGTVEVIKSTVSATQDFAQRELKKKESDLLQINKLLNWIVIGTDSIPLTMESTRDLRFKPLLIDGERFTFGMNYKDTINVAGYFYSITPSRVPDLKVSYPVDQSSFRKKSFPLMKGLATTDGNGNAYITLTYSSQKVKDKFPATITKIYRADGLAWSNNLKLDMLPSEISLNNENGQISIKMTSADGSAKILVVDKNGKVTQ